MKKLNIHLFYEKTGKSKAVKLSLWKLLFWFAMAVVAICGFVLFSPAKIIDKVSDGTLVDLRSQNREIRQSVKELKADNDSAAVYLEKTGDSQDSIYRMGGIAIEAPSDSADSAHKEERTEALFNTYRTYLEFRDSLRTNPSLAKSIPVLHPLKSHQIVTNHFGMLLDHFTDQELPHRGVDFFAAEGDTVLATGAGTVVEARAHRGFGLSVKIQHTDHIRTFYAHLDGVLVRPGGTVKRGDPIAIVGRSGRTAGPGLHYEIRIDGEPVNPEDYFIAP